MTLRIRTYPVFPTRVRATGGISLTKENGEWVFSPDWDSLPDNYPFLRWDAEQPLTVEQQEQVWANIGGIFKADTTIVGAFPPILPETNGYFGISIPTGADYYNVVLAPGAFQSTQGRKSRSTVMGVGAARLVTIYDRCDSIGHSAHGFARVAERCTAVGSIVQQWLGQNLTSDEAIANDYFRHAYYVDTVTEEIVPPSDPAWNRSDMETENPGIRAQIAAYSNWATPASLEGASNSDLATYAARVEGNVGLGRDAQNCLIRGRWNTNLGKNSGAYYWESNLTTGVGAFSLEKGVFLTGSTGVGYQAGNKVQEDEYSVFVGFNAGSGTVQSERTINIGVNAALNVWKQARNIIIGNAVAANLSGYTGVGATELADVFMLGNSSGVPFLSGRMADGSSFLGLGVNIGFADIKGGIHVKRGNSSPISFTAAAGGDIAVFEKDGNGGITIITPNDAVGGIFFADSDDNNVGGFQYDHATNTLFLRANDGNRVEITSSVATFSPPVRAPSLRLDDTNASHFLSIAAGSNLTNDRSLSIVTGDKNRTLDLTLVGQSLGAAGYPAGHYHFPGIGTYATSTIVCSANTLYAHPVHISQEVAITHLVATATSGAGNIRLGVYTNANGYPGTLVAESASTSAATGSIEPAVSATLAPGWYWLAGVCDNTPTLRRMNAIATAGIQPFGHTVADPTSGTDVLSGVSVSHTYGALPATFTGGGTYLQTANHPRFGFIA